MKKFRLAFISSYSLLTGTTGAFMGHGTSNLSRRESNAKLIATYSASPAENDDDSTGTFSSLKNSTNMQSRPMSYFEKKAESRVVKSLDLVALEKMAELHVERDMELKEERNVQRSLQGQRPAAVPYGVKSLEKTSNTIKNSSVPKNKEMCPSSSETFWSNTFTDAGNRKKIDLTPEELRCLELAAEHKVEQQVTQNVERASEIAMEKMVEEFIDRDYQSWNTTTTECWNPASGSKTVTKSTWFVSSYTLSTESKQEFESTPSLDMFSGISDGVSDVAYDGSGTRSEYDMYQATEEVTEDKHILNAPIAVEDNAVTIESSLFGLAQEDSMETIRNLRNSTFTNTISTTDLKSMLENMAERSIQFNANERATEETAENIMESRLQFIEEKDTQSSVIQRGDVSILEQTATTTIGALEQEMFQRSLMATRFKIDQLEIEQRANKEVLMDRESAESSLPNVEYSLSMNGGNEVNDNKDEVNSDVEKETRIDSSGLEKFQRSLMETRLKLDRLHRERLARRKAFITHRKLLEGRLYYELLDRLKQQQVLQMKREFEEEIARESISEKGQRALLATRLMMDARLKEKKKQFIAEIKQRELLKARLDYEMKAKKKHHRTEQLQDKSTPALLDTSLHTEKSEFEQKPRSETQRDDLESIEESSLARHFASEAETIQKMLEKGKSFISKVALEAQEAVDSTMKHPSNKKVAAQKRKKSGISRKDIVDSSKKQRFSLLSKLGFIDDDTEENSVLKNGNKEASTQIIEGGNDLNDKQNDSNDKKLHKLGRRQEKNQLHTITEKELTRKTAAIMLARQQPKSKREEKALQKKYGRLEPNERAFQILLNLGMIIEHPDPDLPNYDHTFDDEFVPSGEWV